MRELFKLIKENKSDDFCGSNLDTDDENVRLRCYDPKLKVKLAVYEDKVDEAGKNTFDQKLMHLNIHSHFLFKLETRKAGEQFEEYSDDWRYLRVLNWGECADILKRGEDEEQDSDDGAEHVFQLTDLERVPVHVVKIDQKNDKICDLVQNVAELLKIPAAKVIILLRNEFSYNDKIIGNFTNNFV